MGEANLLYLEPFKLTPMKLLKQVLGVDVAQKELVCSLGRLDEQPQTALYAHKSFANSASGFKALKKWLTASTRADVPLRVVMEATGVYHQKLAHFLVDHGMAVSIIAPHKISNFMRTLQVKTVTDETCANAIALFGLQRSLDDWHKPDPVWQRLRELTRERDAVISQRTIAKNQRHAKKASVSAHRAGLKRLGALIRFLDAQEKQIKAEIKAIVKAEPVVQRAVGFASSIPGIGVLTAVTILGETNGFELIRNKKQLTSYAGMDIRVKQSGTSVRSKSRISKRGNKHIRKALYLPSLSAVRFNPLHKALYERLRARHGIKTKALVAVQRKLLELSYLLVKNGQFYDLEYEQKKESRTRCKALSETSSMAVLGL